MIFGMGYTLGPIGMGQILGVMSIESAWILVGVVSIIAACFMFLLEVIEDRKSLKLSEEQSIVLEEQKSLLEE